MVGIMQATDMDKLVGCNEMPDAVASLALHIIEFIATDSYLCRYHRRFRHKHEGPSDPPRLSAELPHDELRAAMHRRAGKILDKVILAQGGEAEIAVSHVELHIGAAFAIRVGFGRIVGRHHRDAELV